MAAKTKTRRNWLDRYRTLDCRDAQHDACATCDCQCHSTARRVRVERCIGGNGYSPGWIVMRADGGEAYCIHDNYDEAIACASRRVVELNSGS